jgi:hypothetical protein
LISPVGFILVVRYSLWQIGVKPVHAINVVDGDGPEKLDRDGVGVNGELMA